MKIPESFTLFAQNIQVIEDCDLIYRTDNRGEQRPRENIILIQPPTPSVPMPHEKIEQTFCHELTHYLFEYSGKPELSLDEKYVEIFSHLLHQALTTAKYKEEN
jgi:hypothetical protein